jgi:ABC-type spermidine/putrescine transport system permease subunit II
MIREKRQEGKLSVSALLVAQVVPAIVIEVVLKIVFAQLQVVLVVLVVLLESSTICLPASSLLSSSGNNSLKCVMNRGIELLNAEIARRDAEAAEDIL